MPRHPRGTLPLSLLLIMFCASSGFAASEVVPPTQPQSGPGGAEARFEAVEAWHTGSGDTGYWIFLPETIELTEPLPIVIFLHGYTAIHPRTYSDWIDHIVRRGAVVIYPDYQTIDYLGSPPARYEANAVTGIQAALGELASTSERSVDTTRVALVGHSLGGLLALNIAARAESYDLPVPLSVLSVQPGGCDECGGISILLGIPLADLSQLSPDALVVIMVSDQDGVVGDTGALLAWDRLNSIPLDQRDFVVLRSDNRGSPPLVADHFLPESDSMNGELDALEWFGPWKFLDLLTDCAFDQTGCVTAMNGSSAQLDMGKWSDGIPVVPPIVTDYP